MPHVETNEVIPTAKQQHEAERQDAKRLYRERVIDRIREAENLCVLAAHAERDIYGKDASADRIRELANQAEDVLVDLEES